ncbi:MAG: hypothetical protein HY700_13965 [Gemmatimonadetes bacterium]|nr:hypothetical protein [Gemmatimonadota bacterium]
MSLRILAVMVGFGLVQACFLEPDVSPVTIQAYRCAQTGQDKCLVAGERIPEGALPPMNEAFLVVAKYQGSASRWTLIYPSKYSPGDMDSSVIEIGLHDSASVWINLMGAKDGYYKERVMSNGSVPDSIEWEFGWRRQAAVTMSVQAPTAGEN